MQSIRIVKVAGRGWDEIMSVQNELIETVLADYPDTQAIYLFGSWGTEDEWPTSDLDMAVLLPPEQAKTLDFWAWLDLGQRLSAIVRNKVDLLNVRRVSAVLQKEAVMADRRIYTGDEHAADEFEMLTLSFYQKLNQERTEVLAEGLRSGRFYRV